jgi:hypothetical protein
MTERHPKAVDVQFGGKTYTLLYNLGAVAAVRELGVDAFSLDANALTDPRIIQKLVWAGCLKYHTGITLEQVGDAIELDELGEVVQAFTEALRKAATKEVQGPQ